MFSETESVFLLCKNKACPAQNVTKLIHYCSVIGMDRVGSGIIEKIVEYANLYKIEELYKLTKEQLLAIPGVGETVANNFLNQLHEKSFMTFHTFLVALGLDGLADKNAQIMCNKIVNDGSDDIESALGFLKSDWRWKQEFTEQTAEKIKNSISANYENIQKLALYIRFNWENEKTSEKLTGKSFCITGSLEYAKRDDYIKMIKDNGGEYKSSVGRGLAYLVTNDTESGSSKNKKAKELGIEIISENQLKEML
jgi:DNA ligase (NAD+)